MDTEVIQDETTRPGDFDPFPDVRNAPTPGYDSRWKSLDEWWKDSDQFLPPKIGVNYHFIKDKARYRRFKKYMLRKVAAPCLVHGGEGLWIPKPGDEVLYDTEVLDGEMLHAAVVWWLEEYTAYTKAWMEEGPEEDVEIHEASGI
jgi:hypothetical protein